MVRKATLGLLVLVCVIVAALAAENDTEVNSDDEENEETFEEVEKKLKNAVGSAVKKVLPYILKGGTETDISGPCTASIMKIITGVRQLKEWAIRFLDAAGKIPPGLLEGTSFAIGDYDECLDIEVGKRDEIPKSPEEVMFRGQYCLLEAHRPRAINKAIKEYENGNKDAAIAKTKTFLNMLIRYRHLTNTTFKMGVCVPSKCSKADIENVLQSEAFKSAGKISVSYCKQKGHETLRTEQTLLLCIFGFFLAFMILGTIIDAIWRLEGESKKSKEEEPLKKYYLREIIRNSSLYHNALDVLNTSKCEETLRCLCGVRTITVLLIIYSHTYGHLHLLHFQKYSKAANFLRFFDSFTFSGIANGSVAVDTIVFILGITITYNIWRFSSEKSKVKLGIGKLLLQSYFRMSAAQLLTICMFLLLPVVGSGPFWSAYMNPILSNCRKRWWLNILYINNFYESTDICLYHTWIPALIMQLTLLSILLIWILKKSMKLGIFAMMTLILTGIVGVAVVTVIKELPGSMAFFMLDARTAGIAWRDLFILAYDHIGPFCFGLLAGYFLGLKKDQLRISRITSIFFWGAAIVCNSSVMFGLYSYRHGDKMGVSLSTFYAVMHRSVWSLGIGWLIVACATHHGGAVTRVLNSRIFLPLNRLCYMAYMVHIPIMFYHSGVIRERWYMGHFEMFFSGMAYIVVSFLASFFLHITFVKPYYVIEELICTCFSSRDKVTIESKTNLRTLAERSISVASDDLPPANECVNITYSKKSDGL